MEYTLIIDSESEESLVLTVRERTELVDSIERLINPKQEYLLGSRDFDTFRIPIRKISCFITDNNKVYAYAGNEKYSLKQRLYQLEELLDDGFVKINQGCIINMSQVRKFETTLGGSIKVVLKNGFEDYISRRELKKVKRRFGL